MAELLGPANMAEIRSDILADIAAESGANGITEDISAGSENYGLATGVAGACMLIHARVDGAKDACTPFTATGADLTAWQRTFRLPEVPPSRASGKIRLSVTGFGTVPDGQPGEVNGQLFSVVGNWSPVIDGSEVDVILDEPGSAGNAEPGVTVRLLNPPTNVNATATVSSFEPLRGGYDRETEERRKERVLNRTGTNAGGGNWGQLRQIAFDASPAVQQCFVYPALAGPGTHKVVPLAAFDRKLNYYSRQFPDAALTKIRAEIHAKYSTAAKTSVMTGTDEVVDVSIQVQIPDSTLSGGNGSGWVNATPWPQLTGETRCTITSVNAAGVVTLNALTAVEPVDGQTSISWWSRADMAFHSRTIVAHSGGTGAWVLTLDAPFVDSTSQPPDTGDYISPTAVNTAGYGKSWVDLLEVIGAGENTGLAALLANSRSLRHPFQTNTQPASLTKSQLRQMQIRHPEIIEIDYAYRSATSPTVPATLVEPPNVFVPGKFGVYPT